MAKFFKKFSIFMILALAMLIGGEFMVRNLPNTYSYKNDYLLHNGNEISTLVLGSSHTYYGIAPELLPGVAFNAANVSQTHEYDLLLLKRYLPYLPNLHTVITSASYSSMVDPPLDEGPEWFRAINYKLYMGIDKHSAVSRYGFEFAHSYGFAAKLWQQISENAIHNSQACDSLGQYNEFTSDQINAEAWMANSEQAAKRHTARVPDSRLENIEALDSLAAFCQQHNLNLIIVGTPLYSKYRDAMNKAQIDTVESVLHHITVKYPNAVYMNYRTDADFTEEDFSDASHLNYDKGAKKLTLKLSNDIKTINNK